MTPKRWSILLVALASLIQGAMQFDVIPGTGLGHRLAEFAGWALLTAASVFLPKWFDRAPTLADTAASIGKVAVLLLVALPARAQPVPTDGASAETATCAFSQTDRSCLSARATLLAQASPQPGTPAAVTLPQSRDSSAPAVVTPTPPGAANLTTPVVPPIPVPACKCDRTFWATVIGMVGTSVIVPAISLLFVHLAPPPAGMP